MAMFEFKLRQLTEVMPWGEKPNQELHWFGLTDGCYNLNLGSEKLFQVTDEFILEHEPDYDKTVEGWEFKTYAYYQVVRIYEDLLDILPNVLQSIPVEMQLLSKGLQDRQNTWLLYEDWQSKEIAEEQVDQYYSAVRWYGSRTLNSGHFVKSPRIVFLRIDDEIVIRWENRLKDHAPNPIWKGANGEFKLSVSNFLKEIHLFHSSLMTQMGERVEIIRTQNPIPHIQIDIDGLVREHAQRCKSLELALSKAPEVQNWQEVIDANKVFFNTNA